ncbi:MAG: RpiB/LacA/LacB family sugar-phosphate isomerase [Candidatus Paceibacterota bacterium]
MKIHFGTDHAGFELKEKLVPFVRDELVYDVEDLGAHEYNEEDDYPDFIAPVAQKVSEEPENNLGIILGGSGQGEAIVANRFPNVRAVVINDSVGSRKEAGEPNEVALSREHNQANVLSLGARFLNEDEAKEIVKQWLALEPETEERHLRRLKKIEEITQNIHKNA